MCVCVFIICHCRRGQYSCSFIRHQHPLLLNLYGSDGRSRLVWPATPRPHPEQVSFRQSRVEYRRDSHYLSYPSETLYGFLGTCISCLPWVNVQLMTMTWSQYLMLNSWKMLMTVSLLLKYACIILIHNVVGEMPKVMTILCWGSNST